MWWSSLLYQENLDIALDDNKLSDYPKLPSYQLGELGPSPKPSTSNPEWTEPLGPGIWIRHVVLFWS